MTAEHPEFRPVPQKLPDASLEVRGDGSFIVRSNHVPADVPRVVSQIFRSRSEELSELAWLHEREPGQGPWRSVTYGEARRAADAIGQGLLEAGLRPGDTILVISGNSTEHALLMLACYTTGIVIAPVSTAYSLHSSDHSKLVHCAAAVRPRAVFAKEGRQHALGIARLCKHFPDLVVISADDAPDGAIPFRDLLNAEPGPELERAYQDISPDTVAKYLFTSGSTGMPKCVPQTHGMMSAVVAAAEGLELRPRRERPRMVLLEWMPWCHVSGGNNSFNAVIANGGELYLDEGRPVPGLFGTTIKNVREVSPTVFGSAPVAFAMLADAMEKDADLRKAFFKRLEVLGYGGAALSPDLYDRIQALAIEETGRRMAITTMYGATETQGITMVHWALDRVGLIGLPMPGVELKLAPDSGKLEVRVKGPSVSKGYIGSASVEAFDEEGFYRLGDAARFVDPYDINQGLVFDGRVAEDFKLATGTWVSVGNLRTDLIAACSPWVKDLVVAGHDREEIGLLIWPNLQAVSANLTDQEIFPSIEQELCMRLGAFNAENRGSSRRIARFLILDEPPALDAGEITDKGYINQSAVLRLRSTDVENLFDRRAGTAL